MSTGPTEEDQSTPALPWAFGAFLLVVGVFAVVLAKHMRVGGFTDVHDPGPDALPQLMGYALIAGGLVQVIRGVRERKAGAMPAGDSDKFRWSGAIVLGQVVAYAALLPILGFLLATICFAIGLLRWLGASWKLCVAVAISLVALVSLLFTYVFDVMLPTGVFF